jgi:hypothetical protein
LSVEVPAGSPAFTVGEWQLLAGFPPGTCDLVVDGECDAADAAAALLSVADGAPVDELDLTLAATFD